MVNPPQPKLFSVGAVARETGISPDTLRVWERRYGNPESIRLPSGHRRYTVDQLSWLRRVSEGLARGFRPGKLLRMTETELEQLLNRCEAPPSPQGNPWVGKLIHGAEALDSEAICDHLRASRRELGLMAWLLDVLAPFLRQLGDQWIDGTLGVRHEHLATGIIQTFLHQELLDSRPMPHFPPVLFATLPGEQHSIGMAMAGLVLASHGFPVRLLGPDLPTAELLHAVRTVTTPIIAISVPLSGSGVESDRQIRELLRQLPEGSTLLVGGAGARGVRRGVQGAIYFDSLPELDTWARNRGAALLV